MITVLKNNEGYIYAYAEWRIVDNLGNKNINGDHVYIRNVWIHESRRGISLSALIQQIDMQVPEHIKKVYWRNSKHDRISKTFNRERFKKGVLQC